MKILLLIGVLTAGFLVLRRRKPSLAQRIEGKAKEAVGTVTGDDGLRIEGTLRKTAGRAREAVSR